MLLALAAAWLLNLKFDILGQINFYFPWGGSKDPEWVKSLISVWLVVKYGGGGLLHYQQRSEGLSNKPTGLSRRG